MQNPHVGPAVSLPQNAGILEGEGLELLAHADQLGELVGAHIEIDQLIPRSLAHNAIGREIENLLEGFHGLLGTLIKDIGDREELGNGGIALGDAVDHGLEDQHIIPP